MTASTYLVTWTTWQEQPVTTPWEFWFVSEGTKYRRRAGSRSNLCVTDSNIADAFESRNYEYLDELEQEFINDVKLMTFVIADHEQHAQQQIRDLFPDAQIDRTHSVDDATKSAIVDLVASSQKIKT
jgi:hypothetical protein